MKRINSYIILITIVLICSVLIIVLKTTINKLSKNDNATEIINDEINQADSNTNGAYYNNLNIKYSAADPTMIKYDGCLYVFSTDYKAYKSCDSKNWTSYSFNITGLPSSLSLSNHYFWAPEVKKINNAYYMFFTLVYWGTNYPWSSDSHGSVYYAKSTDLKNFQYIGEMPYGSSYFDGKVDNKNHIDGSLLIDGNNYYFYYKLDTMDKTVPNNDVQELYGIKLNFNSNGTFTEAGNPQLLIRRNKEANPADSSNITWTIDKSQEETIDEGPNVIKKNGKYYLTFSTGDYTNITYRVLVATSTNPLGPYFRDKTNNTPRYFLTGQNYTNAINIDVSGDSNKNIYGPGHGEIYQQTFTDSLIGDYTEYYYVYHSVIYANGKFSDRKFNIDTAGFDSSGNIFVNGPTIDNQPLISGSTLNGVTYYKVPISKYGSTVLSDGIKYSSKSIKAKTLTTNEISFSFKNNERLNITDVWIYGDGSNLGTISGKVYINDGKTTFDFSQSASGSSLKIELPSVSEKVKNIKVVFNKSLVLSEVELVQNSNNNYYLISFDGNGGTASVKNLTVIHNGTSNNKVSNIPTRSGYKFLGWYTDSNNGDLVYKADGSYNKSSYWNSDGKWIYKKDVTLYAHWEKTVSIIAGDVNGDGKVNTPDYILVRKYLNGGIKLDNDQSKRADANSDGKITSLDYIAIRKKILGV